MPDHQQLSILRQVTAEHQDGQADLGSVIEVIVAELRDTERISKVLDP